GRIPGTGPMIPFLYDFTPLIHFRDRPDQPARDQNEDHPMIRTITVAGSVSAQGEHLGDLPDGRIIIRVGLREIVGHPVASAFRFVGTAALALVLGLPVPQAGAAQTLLNVSYDPTRELYRSYNELFAEHWQ